MKLPFFAINRSLWMRHRFLIGFSIIATSSLFFVSAITTRDMHGDVRLYQMIAADLLDNGKMPYRDRVVEYPPYAIGLFIAPRLLDAEDYLLAFISIAIMGDALLKIILFAFGIPRATTLRLYLPLILYCGATPFLQSFYLQRFDIFPALICMIAFWLFCSEKYALSGLMMALGIGVKLYPIVFVPALIVYAMRNGGGWRFATGMGFGLLPMAILSFVIPWWNFAEFHAERGLQVESLWASILWMAKRLGLAKAEWVRSRGCIEVHGLMADQVLQWGKIIFAGVVAVSASLTVWTMFRISRLREEKVALPAPFLARMVLVPLLAFVAFNTVLSPQYLVWLLPFAAVAILEGNVAPVLSILAATLLTPVFYPTAEYSYGLNNVQTVALVLRNLLLVAAWAFLFREMFLVARYKRRIPGGRPRVPGLRPNAL